jgi:serine/threonine protein kinase
MRYCWDPDEILVMFLPLLDSLIKMHEVWICHRDIKPKNLIFTHDSTTGNSGWKYADFGISRLIKKEKDFEYDLCGTEVYMSP